MNTITLNGKEYPTRTFSVVLEDEGEREITISTISLYDAMDDKHEDEGTEENDIDCEIYFYVEDEIIHLTAEEICLAHLDEPIKFLEEIF